MFCFFRFLDKGPLHCISFHLCLIRHYTIFAKTEQGIWQKLRTKLTNQLTGRLFGLLHSAQNLSLCCHLGKVYFLVQAVGIINYLLWLSEDAWGAGSIIYSVLSDKPWYSNIIDLNFPVFVFTSNILPTWHMEMLKCLIKIKFGLIIANFSKSLSETRKNVIISPNKLNKQ